MRIIGFLWRWTKCLTGLHKMDYLVGRESNGKMSRHITRKWCPNCHWSTNIRPSEWFEARRRTA